jgi:peroxiredoxin Q/BCP
MNPFFLSTTLIAMIFFFGSPAARAEPLQIGQAAPDFSLPDQDGKLHALADYRGKWLTLYFYPKDDTPGCTKQACTFRDEIGELSALGTAVVGISVDDSASHAAFARKYNLPFTLLADTKGETAARYDSLRSLLNLKMAKRNTFLIDPEGRIARIYLSVSPANNPTEVIEDLKKLKGS